jgi:hypothetical protein
VHIYRTQNMATVRKKNKEERKKTKNENRMMGEVRKNEGESTYSNK